MKRVLIYIVGLFLSTAMSIAQEYEQAFRDLQLQYQERSNTVLTDVKSYLDTYPYTPYSDEVYFMEGVIHAEKGKYKQANRAFAKVDANNLSRESQPAFLFYWGYTFLQQKNYDRALTYFLRLKNQNSLYAPHARYYAGYCYYCQQDFQSALAEFLSVEQLGGYQHIAPYYIIQIDYAQENYDKVYQRANHLLEVFPDNKNNYELHRMLGELYYQDKAYNVLVLCYLIQLRR